MRSAALGDIMRPLSRLANTHSSLLSQYFSQLTTRRKNNMNDTSDSAELVEQWRNDGEDDNPAGPLFAAGEFAEADIVNATGEFITDGP